MAERGSLAGLIGAIAALITAYVTWQMWQESRRQTPPDHETPPPIVYPRPTPSQEVRPASRFEDRPDGTVFDTGTGLQWPGRDNGADVTWRAASDYCAALSLGGWTDWRLPTIQELTEIHDPQSPARFKIRGGIELTGCCPWSSTRDGPSSALALDFVDGRHPPGGLDQAITWVRALCVRRPA